MLDSPLLKNIGGYVAGQWAGAGSGATLPVRNPATGEHLADVPDMSSVETITAIDAAAKALQPEASIADRGAWLTAIAQSLSAHQQEMARIITLEQGKPLRESRAEVEYSAGFFSYCATQLSRLAPHRLAQPIRGLEWTIQLRPAGVVGLITPWNFPLAMMAKKLAPAIGAGCAIVAKPAEATPLTAVALWHLLEGVGLPPGLANLVIGRPAPIGETLCRHPSVRMISFTGSTSVGKLLLQQAAPHVKRLTLELGGNAPFIVLDDADLAAAVDALMANKFRCAGQTCVCANRVYVQRGIAERFVAAVVARVSSLRVGNGLSADADIGPLINRAAVEKVNRHVRDALTLGARRLVGHEPEDTVGTFYPPTELIDTSPEMLSSQEETFGPVVGIQIFDTDEEAVALANGTPYGLAAYLFTSDGPRATRLMKRLVFGHIGLNTGTGPTPEAPFGGMKQSGMGREGGVEGLLEFCEPQTVVHS